MVDDQIDLTQELQNASSGGFIGVEANELIKLINPDLRKIVRAKFNSFRFLTDLSDTVLLNEAFLRSDGFRALPTDNRSVFFGSFALTVRRVLIDHIKFINRGKRSAQHVDLELEEALENPSIDPYDQILKIDDALEELLAVDQGLASLVAMRFYCGFSIKEIAEKTGMSERSLNRKWKFARSWLITELEPNNS